MDINFPPIVRKTIYVIVVLVTAVVVPLDVAGVISHIVTMVWNSVAGAASLLAALNVNSK